MRCIVLFCVLFVVVLAVNADKESDIKHNLSGTTVRPPILKINKVCGLKFVGFNEAKCAKECSLKGYAKSSCKFLRKCTCKE